MSVVRALLVVALALGSSVSALSMERLSVLAQPSLQPSALLELGALLANATAATANASSAPNNGTKPADNSTAPPPAQNGTAAPPAPANGTAPVPPATNGTAPVPPAAVNSTAPTPGNSTSGNTTAPPAPAGNGTAPPPAPANGTAPGPARNATAPHGNATVAPPQGNGTAPGGNGTAPHGNGTAPAANATAPVNGTNNGNLTAPIGNATAAGNGTIAGNNNTNSTVPVNTNRTGSDLIAPVKPSRGPKIDCPMCQLVAGKPNVTVSRNASRISLDTSSVTVRAEAYRGVPRFVLGNTADKTESKHVMSLERIFLTSAKTLTGGVLPAEQRAKEVVFKSLNGSEPYTWTVGEATTVADNKVVMYSFPLTGVPKTIGTNTGAMRPTIIFDNVFLSNENVTTTKYDFKVDNMSDDYWKGAPNNTLYESFVAVFHIQRQDRVGMEENPRSETNRVTSLAVNHTIPARPVVGVDSRGEQNVTLSTVSSGGIDLASIATAITASGNTKKVAMLLGQDVDGAQAVYFFYERFDKALVHDPYMILNAASLDSAAAGLTPSSFLAVAVAVAAAVATFVF